MATDGVQSIVLKVHSCLSTFVGISPHFQCHEIAGSRLTHGTHSHPILTPKLPPETLISKQLDSAVDSAELGVSGSPPGPIDKP